MRASAAGAPESRRPGASPARRAVLAALAEMARGAKLDDALARAVRRRLGRRDAAFAEELAKAVVRHRRLLDYNVAGAAARPLGETPAPVLDILRMGAAELLLMRTPAFAAVDEAVSLTRARGYAGLAGFVNGVLRTLADVGNAAAPAGDGAAELAVKFSYPDWLVGRWLARFGAAEATALLAAGNERAPLNVYANAGAVSRADLVAALDAEDCRAADGPFGSLAVALGKKPLAALDAFKRGLFAVLDPASTVAPGWLAPPAGSAALDLCAGAGGKTVQLAWLVGPRGRVVAVDASAPKLEALAATAARLHLSNVTPMRTDILKDGLPVADFVLLDAPCTNTGVIRRKPDIKWRLREDDVARAAAAQRELLARAAAAVSPGGRLVYNVCSLEPEEGEDIAAEFLSARDDWRRLESPPEPHGDVCRNGGLYTWPHKHGCNGNFAAAFAREV